jgi:hypothetical protein
MLLVVMVLPRRRRVPQKRRLPLYPYPSSLFLWHLHEMCRFWSGRQTSRGKQKINQAHFQFSVPIVIYFTIIFF